MGLNSAHSEHQKEKRAGYAIFKKWPLSTTPILMGLDQNPFRHKLSYITPTFTPIFRSLVTCDQEVQHLKLLNCLNFAQGQFFSHETGIAWEGCSDHGVDLY